MMINNFIDSLKGIVDSLNTSGGLLLQQYNESKAAKRDLLQPKAELTVQIKTILSNALKSKEDYLVLNQHRNEIQDILLKKMFSEAISIKYQEVSALLSEYWCAVFDMDELLAFYRDKDPEEYEEITKAIEIEASYNTHQELLDQLGVIPATIHEGMNRKIYDYRQIETDIIDKRQQAEAEIKSLYEDMQEEIASVV